MNDIEIKTNFVIGTPSKGKWTGVFASPLESDNTKKYGQLSVIISVSAPLSFDSKTAGDFLLENMQDVYFEENSEIKVIPRLERSILSTAKRLEHLLQREELASEEGIDLQVIAAVVKEGYIYMALLGEGSVILSRDGTIIDLTQGLKDLSGRDLIRSGSGKYTEGDVFVLLSPAGSMDVSEKDLQTSMRLGNFKNLSSKELDPLMGVLMLQISREIEESSDDGMSGMDEESFPETNEEDLDVKETGEVGEEDTKRNVKKEEEDLFEDELQDDKWEKERTKDQVDDQDDDIESEDKELKSDTKDEKFSDRKIKRSRVDGVKGLISNQLEKVKGLRHKFSDQMQEGKTYQVFLLRVRDFLFKIYDLAKKYIWEGLLGMGGNGLYIKGSGPRRSTRGIIILIILVVSLLFISLRALNRHSERRTNAGDVQQVLDGIDEKFLNGRNIGEAGDIEEAVKIIEAALAELETAREFGELTDKIEEKEAEGVSILDEIRRVFVLDEDNIITDIAGYIEGAGASDIVYANGKLYIVDEAGGGLYQAGTDGGEVSYVLGDDSGFSSPTGLVVDTEGNLLVYDKDQGLIKVYVAEKRTEALVGLSQTSVGNVTELDNYVTPDGLTQILYILRAENNDVRKISKYASGYSLPELRLANSAFAGSKDIEIDGRIYILTNSGIIRYFADTQDPFVLTGLDKTIGGSTCFEIDDKLLYFGDSANKRVVVVTKGSNLSPQQGKYVLQFDYRGDGDYFADIKEIIVDDSGRTMYVLAGTKIFKVELFDVDTHAEDFL